MRILLDSLSHSHAGKNSLRHYVIQVHSHASTYIVLYMPSQVSLGCHSCRFNIVLGGVLVLVLALVRQVLWRVSRVGECPFCIPGVK